MNAEPPPTLRALLEGVGAQIDDDVERGGSGRTAALGGLAATMMGAQGASAPSTDLPWLLWYGESFYRWQLFAEGAEYWKGIYQFLKRLGKAEGDEALRAVAIGGAFQVLSGEVAPGAPHAPKLFRFVREVLGGAHPLTKDVYEKLGPSVLASAAPSAMELAAAPVELSPSQPRLAPELAALDPATQRALWVTLAFLDVAASDGKVGEDEYLVWKRTMARLALPDVWAAYGAEGLYALLGRGALEELSRAFATLPREERGRLGGVLVEVMMADGRVEPREVAAVRRISGWLGVAEAD
ncbi:MAG: TerB family tellurite resistance protein [Myxococcales bacterium]|nr:TerB family tellurite resistance protein [Myxococcales bacterium]